MVSTLDDFEHALAEFFVIAGSDSNRFSESLAGMGAWEMLQKGCWWRDRLQDGRPNLGCVLVKCIVSYHILVSLLWRYYVGLAHQKTTTHETAQ